MAGHRSGDLDGGQEEAWGFGTHAGTLDPGHVASLGHRVRGHAVQGVDQVRDGGAGDRQAPGGLAGAVAAQGAGLVAHVGGDLAGGAVQEHERVVQGGGQGRLQAAVGQLGQRELEGLARGLQLADQHGGVLTGGGGGARHGGRRQGDGPLGADAVGQLVGLVDDEDLVVGQDPGVAGHDHAEHGVVGHHEIGPGGGGARQLGEALGLQGAGLSQALGPGDGDLCPGALGDAGDEIVAVTGVRSGRPLAQADHLLAQARVAPVPGGRLGDGVPDAEERGLVLVLRIAAVQAVPTQVVLPALEQGHLGAGAGDLLDGVGGQGRVLGEDLPLQGQGGGGDHDPGTGLHGVDHGGHQVAQRLSRPGAGLHQEVGAVGQGLCDLPDHGGLPLAGAAAHGAHRGVQDVQDPAVAGAVSVRSVRAARLARGHGASQPTVTPAAAPSISAARAAPTRATT